jgi:ADP-ribosylglycohydrolase
VAGSVLGLALGDALGAPFERRRRHEIPRPLRPLELPSGAGRPGSTTDATAMARNLTRSLGAVGALDPDDLMARHLAWFSADPRGVESTVRRVLTRVAVGAPAAQAALAVWEHRGPEVSAGNGSVMYCSPLGVAYANRPDMLITLAPELSGLTHHDERCRSAVLAVTLCAAALIRGEDPAGAVASSLAAVVEGPGGEELEYLTGAVGTDRHVDGPDQGFCLFAAAAGLQAASRGEAFGPGLLRVVAFGGDASTNAAVAGALLGARHGLAALPRDWLDRVHDRSAIQDEGLRLVRLALRGSD